MAFHSSILAWIIPWTEEPGRLQVHGVAKSWTRLSTHAIEVPGSSLLTVALGELLNLSHPRLQKDHEEPSCKIVTGLNKTCGKTSWEILKC